MSNPFCTVYNSAPVRPDTGSEKAISLKFVMTAPPGPTQPNSFRFATFRRIIGHVFSQRFYEQLGQFFSPVRLHQCARLVLSGEKVVKEERLLKQLGARIRDVRQGPDGYLWVLTDASDGRLIRLEPAGP